MVTDELEECRPQDIERRSFEYIVQECGERGIPVGQEHFFVTQRVIHATADFDYAQNLRFSDGIIGSALECLRSANPLVVTDTNMVLAGISKPAAARLGVELHCFMADGTVAQRAQEQGRTRAAVSMELAAERFARQERPLLFAVGNAPTALVELVRLYRQGLVKPALVIAVPVGFVNVVAAKQMLVRSGIPYIAAMGRKGGSTVAAAIMNALLYRAVAQNPVLC